MALPATLNLSEVQERLENPETAKHAVMAELVRLTAAGAAKIAILESGTLELRLATGEIFHIGETAVTRIA